MCSCEAVCGQAVPEEKRRPCGRCEENACRPPPVPPRPPVQRAGTHCVCATQPGALCGVCSSRGRGWERGVGEKGSPHATRRGRWSLPPPHPRVRRAEGVSGGAPWSQEMRVAAQPQVSRAGGILPADEGKADGGWARSPDPVARRVCPAPRAFRFRRPSPPKAAAQGPRHETRRREPATPPKKKGAPCALIRKRNRPLASSGRVFVLNRFFCKRSKKKEGHAPAPAAVCKRRARTRTSSCTARSIW